MSAAAIFRMDNIHLRFTLLPLKWRQEISPERLHVCTKQHDLSPEIALLVSYPTPSHIFTSFSPNLPTKYICTLYSHLYAPHSIFP